MRLRPAWGALLALMLAVGASSQTRISIPDAALDQQEAEESQRISIAGDANERERLREMLSEWRTYVQEGNTADAADVITQMQQFMVLDAVKDERTILAALVAVGNDWAATKSWDLSERAYKAALELAPDYGPAHLGMAEMVRRRDGGLRGHVGLVAGVVQAMKARLGDPLGLATILANAMLILVVAVAVGVAGVAVVLFAKNNRLLRHGMHEALAPRVPDGLDRVIAWAFLLLPMLLFLSPPWWVLWWIALLAAYSGPGLRRLAIGALVVAALLPLAFHLASRAASLPQNPYLRARASLGRHDVTSADLRSLSELATKTDSPKARFLLARLQAAAGRQDDAVDSYTSVLEQQREDVGAIVNRANINFRRGDSAQAIADYKLAVDRDATYPLAWRNGSIAFAQALRADLAEQWMSRAQQLDRGAVQRWNTEAGPDRVVDSDLEFGEVLDLALSGGAEPPPPAWKTLLNPLTLGALAALAFVIWSARRGHGLLPAMACEKCGRAFCARCHAASRGTAYCTQCVHLYVKKDGVSPVVRAAKLREVERHVAATSIAVRVFNLLVPGAGSLYANRLLSGTLTMVAWGAALAALLLSTRMITDPERLGHADVSVLFAIELAFLVVVYLVALTQSLRHSG